MASETGLAILDAEDQGVRFLVLSGYAVFLSGQYAGRSFKIEDGNPGTWKGIILRDLRMEVDVGSLTYDKPSPVALSVERNKTNLVLWCVAQNGAFKDNVPLAVRSDLSSSPAHLRAFFTRWRLVMDVNGEVVTVEEQDAGAVTS